MTQSANPLKTFFRQPALFIKLPSEGKFWGQNSLEMPPNGELGVLPMTALDEITFRTPDALFNGAATATVIESCMPSIKNAWQAPSIDLNTILLAIRIASHGDNLSLDTTCPKCQHESNWGVDLRSIINQFVMPDYHKPMVVGDIEIYFRPMSYEHQNTINVLQFEQQKIIQQLPESSLTDDEKSEQLNNVLKRITEITLKAVSYSVASVRTPHEVVNNPEFIEEYLKNCDVKVYKQIRDQTLQNRIADDIKPLTVTCPNCEHQFDQSIIIDSTLFFDNAS